jgi:hypothetical protein
MKVWRGKFAGRSALGLLLTATVAGCLHRGATPPARTPPTAEAAPTPVSPEQITAANAHAMAHALWKELEADRLSEPATTPPAK